MGIFHVFLPVSDYVPRWPKVWFLIMFEKKLRTKCESGRGVSKRKIGTQQ